MHQLEKLLFDRISSGLKRQSIRTCSKWAKQYRVMGQPLPGPWTFKYHPWLKDMHDCEAELVVGQKSAQMGYTEWGLNRSLFKIDMQGISVLYVLPCSNPDASNFSTSRFDPALELSDHLGNLFTNVKNIHHKRAGSANLFIRGSRSRSQLKSDPVGLMVFDEVDEMEQKNIPLAMERMSGQLQKQAIMLSTPTIDNRGINTYFKNSTQNHFFFPCPMCGKQIELTFPDCIVITAENVLDKRIHESYLKCPECNKKLEHQNKHEYITNGKWVAAFPDRKVIGYYINQLYSSASAGRPWELALAYLKSLTNPADEQEFFNSKLGLTHFVEGAKVSDADIDACIVNRRMDDLIPKGGIITMGVDVGSWLHYEIDRWLLTGQPSPDINDTAKCEVLKAGKVKDFEELDTLMIRNHVQHCVIDSQPESRKALEFANRMYGHVHLCTYGKGILSKEVRVGEGHRVIVDRTMSLDLALTRFRCEGKITLPLDIPEEYKNNVKALVRVYETDPQGNPIGKYMKGDADADHFAHARNYAEVALPLAAGLGVSTSIREDVM